MKLVHWPSMGGLLHLVQTDGTSYRAPSATLHPWTVSRRLWKHFCFYLISDCTLHFYCCMYRIFSIGLWFVRRHWNRSSCYGALEIIVTLLGRLPKVIVVKNIDVRIKKTLKTCFISDNKKHEENICKKTFPLLDIVKIDYRLQNVRLPVLPR